MPRMFTGRSIGIQLCVGILVIFSSVLLILNIHSTHFSSSQVIRATPDKDICVCPDSKEVVRAEESQINHDSRDVEAVREMWKVDESENTGSDTHYEDDKKDINQMFKVDDTVLHKDDDSVAKFLKDKVRVLCWIMTCPQNLESKTIHVKNTWTKRCNKVLFISSETNTDFPTVGINVSEGREHLTAKTMGAFKYIYENHINDADWFMKADDDTYVIVENLRHLLEQYSADDPVYFGHHFKPYVKQGYYSGGAGYVLSREALHRLVTKGMNSKKCPSNSGAEDVAMGKCMEYVGVKTANTTDSKGRSRFHCFRPEKHVEGHFPTWYVKYDANGARGGHMTISDYAISFHYVAADRMYALEYFVYHLRPYGIHFLDGE